MGDSRTTSMTADVLSNVYDPATKSLKTTTNIAVNVDGSQEILIDAQHDSIKIGDGTNTATITDVGGKKSIDVNVTAGGGGGTQYAQATTQAAPTGTVAMGKDTSNVLKALPLSAAGNLSVNLAEGSISGGNAAASPTGSAVPASADYTGFNNGGNLVGVSTANPLPVAQQGAITANAGVNLNTSALALDATVAGLNVAQASTTAGEKGPLIQGAATTNASSYGTGTTNPLSLDTSGNLRVSVKDSPANTNAFKVDGSGVTQPVSGTVTVNPLTNTSAVKAQLQDNAGTAITVGQKAMAASLPVVIASDQTAVPVSGTVTANAGSNLNTSALAVESGGHLASLDTKFPAQGQALAGASMPVVLTAAQVATLTPPTTVGLNAGSALVGKVGIDQTTPGTTNGVQVNAALPAGTNVIGHVIADASAAVIGKVGIDQTTPGTTNLVQVGGSLPAGTNGIGKLTANSGVTIGAVEIAAAQTLATVTTVSTVSAARVVGNTGAVLDSADNAAAPVNALLNSGLYSTTTPALTSGNAGAIRLDSTGAQQVNAEGRKQTFSCALIDFAPIASATAPSVSVQGSASKTIRITRIGISGTAATGGLLTLILKRFSALATGTSASQSAIIAKHDTNNATATAVVSTWSVAATPTATGQLRTLAVELPTPAVTVQPVLYEWTFGDKNGQGLVLRGTGDFVGLCFSAIATTPKTEIYIEWTEE